MASPPGYYSEVVGHLYPLGGFASLVRKPNSMPTLQEILQPRRDIERRAVGRTTINRHVLIYFLGQDSVHACCVRDITNKGAGLGLNGLNIVPFEFGISFDNFHTMRRCRLIWRHEDFLGVAFET